MGAKTFLFVFFAVLEVIGGYRLPCDKQQFRCFNGFCIPRAWFCDNDADCRDGSDERFCNIDAILVSCPTEQSKEWFLCGNKRRCIPSQWRCDGILHCPDGTDEYGCGETQTTNEPSTTYDQTQSTYELSTTYGTTEYFNTTGYFHATETTTELEYSTTEYINVSETVPGFSENTTRIESDNFDDVPSAITTLVRKFLGTRQDRRSVNKWGPHVLRTAVALFLTDSSFFAPGNTTGAEIAYEIALQLIPKLAKMKTVSTQELSLFINAMTVSCINPKDFFGVDLVAELRARVNDDSYPSPFSFLTLCNANDSMTMTDLVKANATFDAALRPLWTDNQAFAAMAMACMKSRSKLNEVPDILNLRISELKEKKRLTTGDLRTTAIVLQALLSTPNYRYHFEFLQATRGVLQELRNNPNISFHDMYYILPVLNSRSLTDISSGHCKTPIVTGPEMLQNLRNHPDERIPVRVSVFVGREMDLVRNWQLKVPANYSFYQVLQSIGTIEPAYKVRYSASGDNKPYVSGVFKFFDDAEKEMYWFTYARNAQDATKPKLLKESPADIPLQQGEELMLWYRPGVWKDPQ